jgi:hypothetical protein
MDFCLKKLLEDAMMGAYLNKEDAMMNTKLKIARDPCIINYNT